MDRLVHICASQSWLHIKIAWGGFRPAYAQMLPPEILIQSALGPVGLLLLLFFKASQAILRCSQD